MSQATTSTLEWLPWGLRVGLTHSDTIGSDQCAWFIQAIGYHAIGELTPSDAMTPKCSHCDILNKITFIMHSMHCAADAWRNLCFKSIGCKSIAKTQLQGQAGCLPDHASRYLTETSPNYVRSHCQSHQSRRRDGFKQSHLAAVSDSAHKDTLFCCNSAITLVKRNKMQQFLDHKNEVANLDREIHGWLICTWYWIQVAIASVAKRLNPTRSEWTDSAPS